MGITATQRRIIALAKKNGEGWHLASGGMIRDDSGSCPMVRAAGMRGLSASREAAHSLGVTDASLKAIERAADGWGNQTLRKYMLKNLVGV